jgi:hypothetical protein
LFAPVYETPCNIRNLLTLGSIYSQMSAADNTHANTATEMSSTRAL